jgi:6-phosphogluconate dehydrogenase
VEVILDTAGQKGTGKWMSQNAFDLGAALPTINAAVEARILSAGKAERVAASRVIRGPNVRYEGDARALVDQVRQALYAAKVCSYAQGMHQLRVASAEYNYNLDLGGIARVWKGGCIIRAALLEEIRAAYARRPDLPNLLMDESFNAEIETRQPAWREVIGVAARHGISCLAMGDSLGYLDMLRRDRLPANLIQAQRDYFGAHTYQRVDREGIFHTEWTA